MAAKMIIELEIGSPHLDQDDMWFLSEAFHNDSAALADFMQDWWQVHAIHNHGRPLSNPEPHFENLLHRVEVNKGDKL